MLVAKGSSRNKEKGVRKEAVKQSNIVAGNNKVIFPLASHFIILYL